MMRILFNDIKITDYFVGLQERPVRRKEHDESQHANHYTLYNLAELPTDAWLGS